MGFAALNTAYTGLIAAQYGIDTTSHNIANADTDGYTRQRVDLKSRLPRDLPQGYVGTGVDVVDVVRARDTFLDARVRAGETVLGSMVTNADLLGRVELVLNEPDDGVSVELDGLFDAWEDLALTPDDRSARVTVIAALERVASRIRGMSGEVSDFRDDTTDSLGFELQEVNEALAAVADLNIAIADAGSSGKSPNDLLDQRDLLLDKLARKLGSNVVDNHDGTVRVSLNGMGLVDGSIARSLTLDNTTYDLVHPDGTILKAGGEIGGYQNFLQNDVPTIEQNLNDFTADLMTTFNTQHALGFYDDTNNGGALYTALAGSEAATIAVDPALDPDTLAVADAGGTPFQTFNGVNAQAMADLRDQQTALGGTSTLAGAYRQLITDLGADVASLNRAADAQGELVAAAELSRTEQHGVSLDEEMVLLIEFQRSYQAASRVITSVDQTLDTLINRTGIVGR
jgi:flagellar hook-associated protein 1